MSPDQEKLNKLIERYFNGDTTVEEEQMLRNELARSTSHTNEVSEARAVLGYSLAQPVSKLRRSRHKSLLHAAASAAIIFTASYAGYQVYTYNSTQAECFAYIDGQKVTDTGAVMSLMIEGLSNVADAAEESRTRAMVSLEDLVSVMNQTDCL